MLCDNNGHVEALLPPDNFTLMLHVKSMLVAQSGCNSTVILTGFEEALKYHFNACHPYLCFQTVICIIVSTPFG